MIHLKNESIQKKIKKKFHDSISGQCANVMKAELVSVGKCEDINGKENACHSLNLIDQAVNLQ